MKEKLSTPLTYSTSVCVIIAVNLSEIGSWWLTLYRWPIYWYRSQSAASKNSSCTFEMPYFWWISFMYCPSGFAVTMTRSHRVRFLVVLKPAVTANECYHKTCMVLINFIWEMFYHTEPSSAVGEVPHM